MGINILRRSISWCRENYKTILVVIILTRILGLFIYDAICRAANWEFIVPDGVGYSVRALVAANIMNRTDVLCPSPMPLDRRWWDGYFRLAIRSYTEPVARGETAAFVYSVGFLYSKFGYHTFIPRLLNTFISFVCAFMIFDIVRKYDKTAAILFILAAFLLPSQVIYSLSISKDFIRMFFITAVIWIAYK